MFAKLAFKNIQRSIKDYAVYFFTLVIGVAIFYVFNSLESQSVMLDVTDRVRAIIDLLNTIMGIVSVFVSFILGALIIYASRFLIKRRSKEFGLYLTLGMSKRQISLVLVLETFLIGLLSLGIGLVLGIVASQFTSVLVANMFDANLTSFQFVFSASAFLKTILYFAIIYIVVMILSTINISRQKLINLLSNGRRNEKIKNKNLWLCTAVFIAAAILLGYAYYLVTAGLNNLIVDSEGPEVLLIPIAMGVVATFALFWSLSGILLRIFMSFKQVYYHKLNSFVLRQFSSKINTTVASMSLICLMLFVTICVLGSAMSINYSLHESIDKALPADVEITALGRDAPDITKFYKDEVNLKLEDWLDDIITYRTYLAESYANSDFLRAGTTSEYDPDSGKIYNTTEEFIRQSDYNRLAKLFELPTVELGANEYAILASYRQIAELRNTALKDGQQITVLDQTLSPKYPECIDGTVRLEMAGVNMGIIIVSDDFKFSGDVHQKQLLIGQFKDGVDPDLATTKITTGADRFYREDGSDMGEIYYYNVETKQDIIDNNVGTSALVTFIGLYLGIIFLISSAAVLALKELSESNDNARKYETLRRIGASNSMLNRALFWQIFIFFVFPLAIAILHSVFGLIFCNFLVSTFGGVDITNALPTVSLILISIYGAYFVITYCSSRRIIRERRQ